MKSYTEYSSPTEYRERKISLYSEDNEGKSNPLISLNNKLKENNFEISKNSRFSAYIKAVENGRKNDPLEIIAWQEIFILLFALTHLKDINDWRNTIETVIRYENPLPDKETVSRSRDALFEVYTAARLSCAGIKVKKGEPDIICQRGEFIFTVAAKRIKSKKNVIKRAKEARKQIINAKLPGIIFLDFGPLQENYYNSYLVESQDQFRNRLGSFLDHAYEPLLPKLTEACKREYVLGIIAFAVISGKSNNGEIHFGSIHNGRGLHDSFFEKNQMWNITEELGYSIGINSHI